VNTDIINPIIIIPVYNGRDSILKLVSSIKEMYKIPIMVVNDGSTDGLNENSLSEVVYLEHKHNRGKGAALKTGFETAKSKGYSHALTLDADGQHDPRVIIDFDKKMRKNPLAMVIGARDLGADSMPFHRKLSNNITSMIISLRSGRIIRDAQVGYRCYPLSDRRLWESPEDGFQFESAVYFNSAKLKMNLIWQEIPVIYSNEGSHMRLVKDTLRFVRTFIRSFKW
jgi:glycosyltransferase involved in cell wall biosynthesis